MEIEIEKVHELCDYVYYGMSVKEALLLSGIEISERSSPETRSALTRAVTYARLKAKFDLMQAAHKQALSKEPNMNSTRLLQHLVSSRCGFSETRSELRLKQKMHEDLMSFRRDNMKQWADYQSSKMIQDANSGQLVEYQKLDQ